MTALVIAPALASAQLPPLEATRAAPHPRSAVSGAPVAFARTFAAARDGDRVLVVYVENDGPRGALRSALFTRTVADGVTSLARARDDVTLAPNVRSVSLTWDGRRGAVAFVVPRVAYVPPPSERPRPRIIARPRVGVPASADDPLGPVVGSGGEVAFLALDVEGAAVGEPRVVFTENSRLWRTAITAEPSGWAVAWTGGVVTDDEVRGTVRALRLAPDGTPARPMASANGWSGDVGDQLTIARVGEVTALVFSGARCVARVGETAPPQSVNEDPSRDIDPPNRNPQPQAPVVRAPGPPVECGPTSLHLARLRDDHTLGLPFLGPWLPADTGTLGQGAVIVPVGTAAGVTFARLRFNEFALGAATDLVTGASITPAPRPAVSPQSTENLHRPAPDFTYVVGERPVPPPDPPSPATLTALLSPPRGLRGAPETEGAPAVAITSDRRGVALVRARGGATLLATTPSLFYDAAVLPGAGGAHLIFTREGTWSGPLRFFAPGDEGPAEPARLDLAVAVQSATPRPSRYPLRAPYVYDAEFARLFARARTLRAQFMRHENIAGMMAARPTAPTDPRMPGLLAVRNNLRNRWEVSCAALRRRATVLARGGAGDDVIHGVNQLCEIHADLVLGQPIDPSL